MTSRNRQVIWFALRYALKRWWSRGWNAIWAIAVLYSVFVSLAIWQIASIYELVEHTP